MPKVFESLGVGPFGPTLAAAAAASQCRAGASDCRDSRQHLISIGLYNNITPHNGDSKNTEHELDLLVIVEAQATRA